MKGVMKDCRAFQILSISALLMGGEANAQWPRFRGPNGSGTGMGSGYPVEFSAAKNMVWKTAVPQGQSSPVVVGTRIYFTASEADRLLTICLDARTGQELWRREIRRERAAKIYKANDPASPTPAADETGVYVFFPDFGLASYTLEGKERWRHPLGPFRNFYGMSASPIVAGGLVILLCDQQAGSFLLALDAKNGTQRWRTERPGMTIGWSTPAVFQHKDGPPELIVQGTSSLDSYYLATGERRWWKRMGSAGSMGTPVFVADALLVSTLGSEEPMMQTFAAMIAKYDQDKDGRLSYEEFRNDPDFGEHFGWIDDNGDKFIEAKEWNEAATLGTGDYGAMAVRPGNAQGELPASAVRWRVKKSLPYVPAPLAYQNIFYLVRSGGIVTSINPSTGAVLKQGRADTALGEYYASPVAADGKLYLASEEGKMAVLKAGAQWEVLAVNDLGDEIYATPALSEGRIYVRTRTALYCFAATPDPPIPASRRRGPR